MPTQHFLRLATMLIMLGWLTLGSLNAQITVMGSCVDGTATLPPAGIVDGKPAYNGTASISGMPNLPLQVFWSAIDMVWILGSNGAVLAFNSNNTPEPPSGTGAGWMDQDCTGPQVVVNSAPLPVGLTAFAADAVAQDVHLTWRTASERDNRGFIVERLAADGLWAELSFVAGAGSTQVAQYYAYIDVAPSAGTHLYRLRQVDFDGAVDYSEIVSATMGASVTTALRLSPNPSAGEFKVAGPEIEGRLRVVAADGRVVLEEQAYTSGTSIAASGLDPGYYIVHFLAVGAERLSAPLIVTR